MPNLAVSKAFSAPQRSSGPCSLQTVLQVRGTSKKPEALGHGVVAATGARGVTRGVARGVAHSCRKCQAHGIAPEECLMRNGQSKACRTGTASLLRNGSM